MKNYVITAGSFLDPPSSFQVASVGQWLTGLEYKIPAPLFLKLQALGFNLHSRVSHLLRLSLKLWCFSVQKGVHLTGLRLLALDTHSTHSAGPWLASGNLNICRAPHSLGFSDSSVGKESAYNAGDPGLIPGSGRCPREGIGCPLQWSWASLVAQLVKNPPTMPETWFQSLGWEDPLEKGKAIHSSILACKVPWTVHGVAKSQTRLSNFHCPCSLNK